MLIETDHTGKKKSIYQCDMCKKVIYTAVDIRYKITAAKPDKVQMKAFYKWDLCEHCYHILEKSIKNYRKR